MIYKKIKEASKKKKALREAAKRAAVEVAAESSAQSTENLLKMNAIEAVQAGAQGTGIDLDKKATNPITYKSSPTKRHNGTSHPEDGDTVSIDGTAHTFIKESMKKAGESGGYTGGGTFKNKAEKDWYDGQIKKRVDSGMSNEDAVQDYRNTFQIGTKKPNTPASVTTTTDADPLSQTIKKGPTQRYNMGEKAVEDANTAKGRMRRGLNREERKGMKDIVKGLDPTKRQEFRDNMKAQRNIDRDGDNKTSFVEKLKNTFGGNRQQKKLNALNAIDGGSVKKEFGLKDKTIRQDVAKAAQGAYDFGDRSNMSERDKKIDAASQSKYSFGLNNFGDFKAGSTTTGPVAATDDMQVVDRASLGTTTTFSPEKGIQVNNSENPFSGMDISSSDYQINMPDAFKGLATKKGYKGKNAVAFKSQSGRGAGY